MNNLHFRSDYAIHERNCLYKDELSLQLFKSYTKRGCEFECGLAKATKSTGCAPWNYVHLEKGLNICIRDQVLEFEKTLVQAQKSEECARLSALTQ